MRIGLREFATSKVSHARQIVCMTALSCCQLGCSEEGDEEDADGEKEKFEGCGTYNQEAGTRHQITARLRLVEYFC